MIVTSYRRKFMKRLVVICLVLLIAISGAFVFGEGSKEEADTGPITIDFWYSVGGNPGKATEVLVERFNQSQDKIIVEGIYSGSYEETTQKLLASVVSGDTPAVAHMAMAYTAQFILSGYFEGLNSYFAEDDTISQGDFVLQMLDLNRWEGDIYGLPFNCSNPVLYYNKDLFKAAGLDPEDPPETWDEVYAYSKAISALGDDIYGINIERGSGWITQGYTWQFGGDWIEKDNSSVLWTDAPAVNALAFMQKMVNDGIAAYKGGNALDVSGKSGMVLRSTASLTGMIGNVEYDLGVAVQPYAVKRQVPIGGGSLYVFENASTKEKQAAWEFLKFMGNPSSQMYWAKATGYQASATKAVNSLEMKNLWEADPRYKPTYDQIPYSLVEDNTRLIPFLEVRDIFNDAWDRVILNNLDPATELEAAQELANEIIAEY
jgi:sn-glycerol 3-phosphate transport system substrate-binding protein